MRIAVSFRWWVDVCGCGWFRSTRCAWRSPFWWWVDEGWCDRFGPAHSVRMAVSSSPQVNRHTYRTSRVAFGNLEADLDKCANYLSLCGFEFSLTVTNRLTVRQPAAPTPGRVT